MIDFPDDKTCVNSYARQLLEKRLESGYEKGTEERVMGKLKKVLDRIFIDGLSGMAQGLFATLIWERLFSRLERCLAERPEI